jgi:hypothetical protein
MKFLISGSSIQCHLLPVNKTKCSTDVANSDWEWNYIRDTEHTTHVTNRLYDGVPPYFSFFVPDVLDDKYNNGLLNMSRTCCVAPTFIWFKLCGFLRLLILRMLFTHFLLTKKNSYAVHCEQLLHYSLHLAIFERVGQSTTRRIPQHVARIILDRWELSQLFEDCYSNIKLLWTHVHMYFV